MFKIVLFANVLLPILLKAGHANEHFGETSFLDRIEKETARANSLFGELTDEEKVVKNLFAELTPLYLPKLDRDQLSSECYKDVRSIHAAFNGKLTILTNLWALKLFDSWGKFEDGILQGNSELIGYFEECIAVQGSPPFGSEVIKGQYCLMRYEKEDVNYSERMPQIIIPSQVHMILDAYATCMPASCTAKELQNSVNLVLNSTGISVVEASCQTADDEHEFNASEIFGICFFSLIALLLVVASAFDLITADLSKTELRKKSEVLLAFSVPQNFSKIMTLDTKPSSDIISCIHGIRVFSILWVIVCHQYVFAISFTSNAYNFATMTQKFYMQCVLNGDKSVDTFFTISGFLVAYNVFKGLKKNPKFPFAMYYIHRLIRLTPPLAIACAFFATLAGFFVSGPFKDGYQYYQLGCQHRWWADVLYISNLYMRYGETHEGEIDTCLGQSWYTSLDTQMYIVMPIVILPLYFMRKKGLAWFTFWLSASVIVPAAITGAYQLYPTSLLSKDLPRIMEFQERIYLMPWARMSPYLVGVLAGYILYKYPKGEMKMSRITVAIGWILMGIMSFTIIYSMAPFNQVILLESNPADDMSNAVAIIYGGLNRGLWGVCISWIILACHWGYGGPVNSFLSYPVLQPLSRLTYSTFLMALGLQVIRFSNLRRRIYATEYSLFEEVSGIMIVSFLGGMILSLISESPTLRLEKLAFGKGMVKSLPMKNGIENKMVIDIKEDEFPSEKNDG